MPKVEIYISYAWRDREKDPALDDRETIVDDFCKACEERGYTVKRDKTNVGYRDSIEKFMYDIGAGKYVVAVVSDKYLRSEYCMFEAVRMLMNGRFEERVFPIVLSDATVFEQRNALQYVEYWQKIQTEFSAEIDRIGRRSALAEFELKERDYKDIHERVGQFIAQIVKQNVLSTITHLENGFTDIFAALEKQIAADNNTPCEIDTSRPVPTSQPFLKRISQDLLEETISCFDVHRQQIDIFFQNPHKRVLLITGPNESGKTHLLRDVVREASEEYKWACFGVEPQDFDTYPTTSMNDNHSLLFCLDDAEYQEENILNNVFKFVHSHPNTRLVVTAHHSWYKQVEDTARRFKDFSGLISHIELSQWKNEHLLQLLRLAAGGAHLENEEDIVRQFPNPYLLKYFGEASIGKTQLDVVGIRRNFSEKLRRVCNQALQPLLKPEQIQSLLLFLVFHHPQDYQLTEIAPQLGLDEVGIQSVFEQLKDANIIRRKRGIWYLFPTVKGDFYLAGQLEEAKPNAIEALIRPYLVGNEKAIFSIVVAASRFLSDHSRKSVVQALANILNAWQKETRQQPDSLSSRHIEAATEVLDLVQDQGIENATNAACILVLNALVKQTALSSPSVVPEGKESLPSDNLPLAFFGRKPDVDNYGRFLEKFIHIKRKRDDYLMLVQTLWEAGWKSQASNYQPETLLANAFKPVYNDTASYQKGLEYARSWLFKSDRVTTRQLGVMALETLLGGFFEHISHEYMKMVMRTDGLPDNADLYAIRDSALQIVREGIQQESLQLDCLRIIHQIGFGGRFGNYQDIFKLPSYPRIQAEIESMIPLVGELLLTSQDFLVQKEAEINLVHWWVLNISDKPEPYLLRFERTPEYMLYRYLTNGQYITANFAAWKTKAPQQNRWEWYVKSDDRREERQWKSQSDYFKPLVHQLSKRYHSAEDIAHFIQETAGKMETWLRRERGNISYALQQLGSIVATWAGLHPETFKDILNDTTLSALLPENVRAVVGNYLTANNHFKVHELVEPLLINLPNLTWAEMNQLIVLILQHQPVEKEIWLQKIIREGTEPILHEITFRLDFLFNPESEIDKIAEFLLLILKSGKITQEEFFGGRGAFGASFTYETLAKRRAKLSPHLYEDLRAMTFDWVKKISNLEEDERYVLRFCICTADHLIELIDYRASNWSVEQAAKNLDFHIEHVLPNNTFNNEELLELFKNASDHRRFIDKIQEWERAAGMVFPDWKDAYLNIENPETGDLWIEQHLRDTLTGQDLEKAAIYCLYIPNQEQYIPLLLDAWQQILPTRSDEEMESLLYRWATKRSRRFTWLPVGYNRHEPEKVLWDKIAEHTITNPRLKIIIRHLSEHFEERWRGEEEE